MTRALMLAAILSLTSCETPRPPPPDHWGWSSPYAPIRPEWGNRVKRTI